MRHKFLPLAVLALAAVPSAAHAAGFDVETATRAWLDTLQGPARAKSDAYFEGGYWLVLWGTVVSVLIDGLLLGQHLDGGHWLGLGIIACAVVWAERQAAR